MRHSPRLHDHFGGLALFFLVGANPEHRPERSKTGKGGDEGYGCNHKSHCLQTGAHLYKKAYESQCDADDKPYDFVDAPNVFFHGTILSSSSVAAFRAAITEIAIYLIKILSLKMLLGYS